MSARGLLLIFVMCLGSSRLAEAGMPSFTLSDIPVTKTRGLTELVRMRLEVISFFGGVLLLSAAAIRWIWNSLRKDFPRLPRISYAKSLGVVFLWGLLFLLVLTMISGARELMTPGAWVKKGFTYKLAEPALTPQAQFEVARYQAISRLRRALQIASDAEQHDRDHTWAEPEYRKKVLARVTDDVWRVPGASGSRYIVVDPPEDATGAGYDSDVPHIYEPEGLGTYRLVLLFRGEIRAMTTDELNRALKK